MSDGAAHDAEVAGCNAQSAAEMPLPEAVGDDAGRERVVGAGEPSGQVSAAKGGMRSAERGVGDARKGRWDGKARAAVVAADPETGCDGLSLAHENADRRIALQRRHGWL